MKNHFKNGIIVDDDVAIQMGQILNIEARHDEANNIFETSQTLDSQIEQLWNDLRDVPFEEDNDTQELYLAHDWQVFTKGTWRETIWLWFDAYHSKGVASLL
ncbi:hypothetical protein [Paenibacillus periandrae]|uniref:hypothetical protein n=1 Tax=Paenibacillus periandrae TaxID=1761741 RepID=UPI001F093EA8|nr:hypothetical protein [Paenibacillus periandrae]